MVLSIYLWLVVNYILSQTKKVSGFRDIEVKSNLTIARGEWGGDSGKRGLQ